MKVKKTNNFELMILLLLLFITGCTDPDPLIEYQSGNKGVFICNEGNFTFGNASLSFYNPDSSKVQNQVFFNTNLFPVGDVLQSITIRDTLGFLVINNSGKIFVISTNTFRHVATVSGLNSPRHMLVVNHHKAYVSDLYSKSISIIDPNTFEVTGSVEVGSTTEQLVQFENDLFVTSWSGNNKVYRIDTGLDIVTDSLTVALQPNSIVLDKHRKLWVLSDGAYPGSPYGTEIPALTRIDPVSFTIEKEFSFPGTAFSPSRLTINSGEDTLCFLNGGWADGNRQTSGICRMSIDAEALPEHPVIAEGNRLFYGLGVDPHNSDIYVSDALDYLQKGWVFRYSANGTPLDSFRVDIAPGGFGFK